MSIIAPIGSVNVSGSLAGRSVLSLGQSATQDRSIVWAAIGGLSERIMEKLGERSQRLDAVLEGQKMLEQLNDLLGTTRVGTAVINPGLVDWLVSNNIQIKGEDAAGFFRARGGVGAVMTADELASARDGANIFLTPLRDQDAASMLEMKESVGQLQTQYELYQHMFKRDGDLCSNIIKNI